MADIKKLIDDLTTTGKGGAAAFDEIVAAGLAAVPVLVDALAAEAAVPLLTAALAAIQLDDPIAVLEPLRSSSSGTVVEAALTALAATGDPRAVPIIAANPRQSTVVDALGETGRPEAIPILRARVTKWLGDDLSQLPPAEFLSSRARRRDLAFICNVAGSLGRLGDQSPAGALIHIAGMRGQSDHEGADVRAAAGRALWWVTAPGVAAALARLARDPNVEVAVNGLLGTLYLARAAEVECWISLLDVEETIGATARMCLEAFAGESPGSKPGKRLTGHDAAAWWSRVKAKFSPGVCYRLGQPAHPGLLLPLLEKDPSHIRTELLVHGAAPVTELLDTFPVSHHEQARLKSWWQTNASRFPPGKLHRAGRTFEPGSVD